MFSPEVQETPRSWILQDVITETKHGQETEEENKPPDDNHDEASRPWSTVLCVEECVLHEQEPLYRHGADNQRRAQTEAYHDEPVKPAEMLSPWHLWSNTVKNSKI